MLQLQIIAGAKALPIYDLPAALGRTGAAKEVADQIEALIAFLDDLGGDPDLEDGDFDRCIAGDDGCGAFLHPWTGEKLWGSAEEAA